MQNARTAFGGIRAALLAVIAVPLGSAADTFQVTIETSDQQVYSDGTGAWSATTTARVGNHSPKTVHVMPFALPALPAGHEVASATLSLNLEGWNNWGGQLANADLYGILIGSTSNNAAVSSYFVDGENPSNNPDATLLHDNLLTPNDIGSTTASGQVDGHVSGDIGSFVQAFYDNDFGAGDYGFLSLAHDGPLSAARYYTLSSADSNYAPVLTIVTQPSNQTVLWVDINASAGGDGSQGSPFKTIDDALAIAQGGDTIYLEAGAYPTLYFQRHTDLFDNWVTIKPAPDISAPWNSVSIQNIQFQREWSDWGMWNAYLRFEDLHIVDGFSASSVSYIDVNNCLIERLPPYTGSKSNILKAGVELVPVRSKGLTASHITVRNSEITNTSVGVVLNGDDNFALNNEIHHVYHDGMHVSNAIRCVAEGNTIYNCDDGVDDDEGYNWNRHNDCIHIFPSGSDGGQPVTDVVIRGNILRDSVGQGIMVNGDDDLNMTGLLIENNLFGLNAANPLNMSGAMTATVRGNTFVPHTTATSFTSVAGRTIDYGPFNVGFPSNANEAGTALAVYNNYLPKAISSPYIWHDYNVYAEANGSLALARNESVAADPLIADPTALNGILLSNSPLIDAGTRILEQIPDWMPEQSPIYADGLSGVPRDARPDVGSTEFPDGIPTAETPLPVFTGPATLLTDDFSDANLYEDPWLAGTHVKGLDWVAPEGQIPWGMLRVNGNNYMSAKVSELPLESWIYTADGDTWDNYELTFTAQDSTTVKSGVIVRANVESEGYFIDLRNGKIFRRQLVSGSIQSTEIATTESGVFAPLVPYATPTDFVVTVETIGGTATISVESTTGTLLIQAQDSANSFPTGRVGFHSEMGFDNNNNRVQWRRLDVDNVVIDLSI